MTSAWGVLFGAPGNTAVHGPGADPDVVDIEPGALANFLGGLSIGRTVPAFDNQVDDAPPAWDFLTPRLPPRV
jgi:hypothetical protein